MQLGTSNSRASIAKAKVTKMMLTMVLMATMVMQMIVTIVMMVTMVQMM